MENKSVELRPRSGLSHLRIRKVGPARRSFRGVPNPDYDPQYDYLYADKDAQIPIRQIERAIDGKLALHAETGAKNTPKNLQVTPEEEAQSFGFVSVSRELRHLLDADEPADMVICTLGDDDRLLKTVSESGAVVYLHQRYGRLREQTAQNKPRWHTIFAGDTSSPQEAVDRGEQRLGKEGIVTVVTE